MLQSNKKSYTRIDMHIATLEEQRKQILNKQPEIQLTGACKVGEGIIELEESETKRLSRLLTTSKVKKTMFIPASGSGSRMFEFLFEFMSNPTEANRGQVERFLNHIEDFAFFYQFPSDIQQQLRDRTMDIESFVAYILNNKGFGLAHLPKGLVPFHKHGPFLLNPFHEHVLQGLQVSKDMHFHFTIRPSFMEVIRKQLSFLEGMISQSVDVSFSEQNPDTDAFAFDELGSEVRLENGELLRRPSGHGALLQNLESVDADLLFIKNIDNVQHYSRSEVSTNNLQVLGGLLLDLQKKINSMNSSPSIEAIVELNSEYQLFHPDELQKPLDELLRLLDRPIRVCGMVRNEGQPGGGPFWVQDNSGISKQIVEKAQIDMRGEQYRVMIQSTHFNPVMMVCEGRKADGRTIDFDRFKDASKYFVVNKNHQGTPIRFIELPGLWNGSMAHWNTVFVEIPSSTFSPVKTILDLLEPAHLV
jgi:hypothetical protein